MIHALNSSSIPSTGMLILIRPSWRAMLLRPSVGFSLKIMRPKLVLAAYRRRTPLVQHITIIAPMVDKLYQSLVERAKQTRESGCGGVASILISHRDSRCCRDCLVVVCVVETSHAKPGLLSTY